MRKKELLLILLVLAVTPLFVINYVPSTHNYSLINVYWNGYSEFEATVHPKLIASPADLLKDPKSIYIIIPARNYTQLEIEEIIDYTLRGGTILLLSDRDNPANQILKDLGIKSRFDGHIVRDPFFYEKNPGLVFANLSKTTVITTNATQIELDQATIIRPSSQAIALYKTSSSSYIDLDGNGYYTEGEPRGSFPVVVYEPMGNGGIILISDPDIWINGMIDKSMNKQFLIDLIKDKQVFLDISHLDMAPYELYHIRISILRAWLLRTGLFPLIFAPLLFIGYRRYNGIYKYRLENRKTIIATITALLILTAFALYYSSNISYTLSTSLLLFLIVSVALGYTTSAGYALYMVLGAMAPLGITALSLPLLLVSMTNERRHNRENLYYYIVIAILLSSIYKTISFATLILIATIPFLNILSNWISSKVKIMFVKEDDFYAGTENKLILKIENESKLPITLRITHAITETIVKPKEIILDIEPSSLVTKDILLYTEYSGKKKIIVKAEILEPTGLGKALHTLQNYIIIEPIHRLAKRLAVLLLEKRSLPTTNSEIGIWQPDHEYIKQVQAASLHTGDYMGVREYIPGDDPRMIHWKKSISQLRLITIERVNPSKTNLIILGDLTYTEEKELDKQVYQIITLLESIMISSPSATSSLYIYTEKNILYINEKQKPEQILIDLLKKLPEIMEKAREEKKAYIEEEIALSNKYPQLIRSSFYNNYTNIMRRHPVAGIIGRILASSRPSTTIIMMTIIKQPYNIHHVYSIVKTRLKSEGYRMIDPPKIEPETLKKLVKILKKDKDT